MSKKNIEINLTDGAGYNAGQVGENRAVELFIHIPKDMYDLDHYYRLVFSNGVVTPMLRIIPPENEGEDGVIQYFLESELTSASSLNMQLEEYGEDELIDKSSIVTLKFGNSLTKPKEVFFNKDIISEINQNTIYRHTHPNLELLNSITPEDLGGGGGSQVNIVTSISEDSTDDEVPSAKAVYDAIPHDVVDTATLQQESQFLQDTINGIDGAWQEKVVEIDDNIENLYSGVDSVSNRLYENMLFIEHELLSEYYRKDELNRILGNYVDDVAELIDENLELIGGESDE